MPIDILDTKRNVNFFSKLEVLLWLGFVIFDRHKLTKRSGDASFRTPTMNIILGILNLGSLISVFCYCTQPVKGWFQAVRWLANVRHNVWYSCQRYWFVPEIWSFLSLSFALVLQYVCILVPAGSFSPGFFPWKSMIYLRFFTSSLDWKNTLFAVGDVTLNHAKIQS